MSFLSTDITSYGYWLWVVSSSWSFVFAILGQMTYSVASLTVDSAGSYVMQGAPFTQGTIPIIPIGGSISPEGFLPSILLVVVIIVTVVVVIVVVVDDVSLILKLSFVIIGWAYAFHQDMASSVKVPVANVTLFSLAQLLRENTNSVRSNQSSSRPGVPVRITSICHCCSLCFQSYGNAISNQLLDGSQTLRVYGMVHNDEDGDNDANDGDDDERRDKLVL
ncbi:hypothetical protein Tco_0815625 [Tanacetum coccineum]